MNRPIHHFFPKKMIFKFITRIDIEFSMHCPNRRPLNTRYPEGTAHLWKGRFLQFKGAGRCPRAGPVDTRISLIINPLHRASKSVRGNGSSPCLYEWIQCILSTVGASHFFNKESLCNTVA